jgi:hypothetical protein
MARRPSVALKLIDNTDANTQQGTTPFSEKITEKSRSVLRETGIPRSPGGTPVNRRRTMDENTPDTLQSALTKKFRSVRLPESPIGKFSETTEEEWEESNNNVNRKIENL